MPKKRLIVISSAHPDPELKTQLEEYFPDDEIQFLSINASMVNWFNYPTGLSSMDYPYIGKPEMRDFGVDGIIFAHGIKHTLIQADEIIYACTPTPNNALAFYLTMSSYLGGDTTHTEYRIIKCSNNKDEPLTNPVANMETTLDEWFVTGVRYAVANRYFNYNFNVNSKRLFAKVLRHLELGDDLIMKASDINLLYFISKQSAPLTPTQVHSLLALKSPLTETQRKIKSFIKRGFFVDQQGMTILSSQGKAFLQLLAPRCYDPKQEDRLHQWFGDWPESKPAMDRYLTTYFDRQKWFFKKRIKALANVRLEHRP